MFGQILNTYFFLITDVSNVMADNGKKNQTIVCETKNKSKGNNDLMFATIELTAVSFIIFMMYLYTQAIEKHQLNSSTV